MIASLAHRFSERLFYRVRFYSSSYSLRGFLRNYDVDLVMDVGANEGQFGSLLRRLGYRGPIVSFEPVKSVCARLSERAKSDPDWSVRNLALGERPSTATIHVSRNTVFSSIKRLNEGGIRFNSDAVPIGTEEVVLRRLDDFFDSRSGFNILLQIDTL